LVQLNTDGLYRTSEGIIWIPAEFTDLQLRICVVGHTGLSGHRGTKTTVYNIRSMFYWPTLQEDVTMFCSTCLHCCSSLGGDVEPRPWGEALHASTPNEVLHFDFLFMGPADTGDQYLLLLKDDLSSFVWLVPCATADTQATAIALMDWFSLFGISRTWVSDRGSHLKNKIMETIRQTLRTRHHFTTANSPWANGTVERLCREVLRATRALLSESKLRTTQWTEVHRIVQSVLNNTPSPHRNNIAPVTAFTGLPPSTQLLSITPSPKSQPLQLTDIRARQLMEIELLQSAIENVHKEVCDAAQSRREKQRKRHLGKRSVHAINFGLGDFVHVAKRDFRVGEKLTLRWRGPKRIVGVLSDFLFEVEDLRNGTVSNVHAQRLRFYHYASLNVTAELIEHVSHNE
jgi:Integrase zinc binding domain/Integrase core domain